MVIRATNVPLLPEGDDDRLPVKDAAQGRLVVVVQVDVNTTGIRCSARPPLGKQGQDTW